MPRETAQDKARRYLVEGRVILDRVGDGVVSARVRGDGAVHRVDYRWAPVALRLPGPWPVLPPDRRRARR
jgi:hypothetical protein